MYNRKNELVDRREMLKVKFNSLMEEARIIRKAEKKAFGVIQAELHLHRISVVRSHARAASLALGFIKGRTLEQMEPSEHSAYNLTWRRTVREVYKNLSTYGSTQYQVRASTIAALDECAALAQLNKPA